MLWRTLFLTYPIWGSIFGFGLWSLLPRHSAGSEALLGVVLLPILAPPLPIWITERYGVVQKFFFTILLYMGAYISLIYVRFGVACALFHFSCAMG